MRNKNRILDKELLEDTSFDREGEPKDQARDLLVNLFKRKPLMSSFQYCFFNIP